MVGNHVADIVARYGADGATCPRRSPTTSRAARATTTTSTAARATRTPRSSPTRSSTGSASSARADEHLEQARRPARARRQPVRHLPAARRPGRDAAAVRGARHPGHGDVGRRHRMTASRRARARRSVPRRRLRVRGPASDDGSPSGCSRCSCSPPCGSWSSSSCRTRAATLLGASVLPRTDDVAMPHVWTIGQRMLEPETSAVGLTDRAERHAAGLLVHAPGRAGGLGAGVGRRLPHRRADAAVAGRRVARCCRGSCSARPSRSSRSRPWWSAGAARSSIGGVRVAALDVGRAHRVLPGVLPGRGRRAARAAVAARGAGRAVPCARRRVERARCWACGCPASVPYLLPALRLGAATAVVGAIVAEVSTGTKGGIGRMIISLRPGRERRPRQAVGRHHRRRDPRPGRRRARHAARARSRSLPPRGGLHEHAGRRNGRHGRGGPGARRRRAGHRQDASRPVRGEVDGARRDRPHGRRRGSSSR